MLFCRIFSKTRKVGKKLKYPLFFWAWLINNYQEKTQKKYFKYSDLDSQNYDVTVDGQKISLKSNYISAIKAATLISVRDRASWFLVEKYKAELSPLYLTGCPTLFSNKIKGQTLQKQYDLGINILFSHSALCHKHRETLAKIALYFIATVPNSVWICHSEAEEREAKFLLKAQNINIPVIYPKTFEEVADVYSRCTAALVTKLHSAYFCLANNVPFGFISYDIKCDFLLEMLYDSIAPYSLNLYDLENYRLDKKLEDLLKTLTSQFETMKSAETGLMGNWKKKIKNSSQILKNFFNNKSRLLGFAQGQIKRRETPPFLGLLNRFIRRRRYPGCGYGRPRCGNWPHMKCIHPR